MKTTTIYQTTAAILTMFVIMLFSIGACSPNDDPDPVSPIPDPDPDPGTSYYSPGDIIPRDDFPQVIMPLQITSVMDVGDEIGEPIFSKVEPWQGNLRLSPQKFRAQSLSGGVWRK
ncbi:hypothetical protein, partial [Algibacter sp.]|uniref:hypothetical protein n=1 Tax=Algibacter sp. TaxID=1872428 RepID=UPI003C752418